MYRQPLRLPKQIIEGLQSLDALNSSRLLQLLEETYPLESHQQIKADLLKQIKDRLLQCQKKAKLENLDEYLTKSLVKKENCYVNKGRYTGTDMVDSRIMEIRTLTINECQKKCVENEECQYFLYFSKEHYQRFKHYTCRLLR